MSLLYFIDFSCLSLYFDPYSQFLLWFSFKFLLVFGSEWQRGSFIQSPVAIFHCVFELCSVPYIICQSLNFINSNKLIRLNFTGSLTIDLQSIVRFGLLSGELLLDYNEGKRGYCINFHLSGTNSKSYRYWRRL